MRCKFVAILNECIRCKTKFKFWFARFVSFSNVSEIYDGDMGTASCRQATGSCRVPLQLSMVHGEPLRLGDSCVRLDWIINACFPNIDHFTLNLPRFGFYFVS